MNSYNEIQVSQILYCNNGEPVVVINKTDTIITVEYKGQLHTRPLSIIGDKLHTKCKSASIANCQSGKKDVAATPSIINQQSKLKSRSSVTDQQLNLISNDSPSCFQCMLQARDDCFGMPHGICEKFVQKPEISADKQKNWPKYGDASAYRLGEHRDD